MNLVEGAAESTNVLKGARHRKLVRAVPKYEQVMRRSKFRQP
jgi:hypothetical protein